MSIQFHCPNCQKLLTTSDDKAGARAKCPGCSEVVTVPAATPGPEIEETPRPRTGASPVKESSAGGERVPCPMCGERIAAQAVKCRYCGEMLDGSVEGGAEFEPTQVTAGEIFNTAWKIFGKNVGMCVGLMVVAGLIPGALLGIPMVILGALADNRAINDDVLAIFMIPLMLVSVVLVMFLTIGQTSAFLKMARGETVQISDLFSGGKYFFPALGASLLFGAMYMVGAMLCFIPALFVLMIFWPYLHLIVDGRAGAIESLSKAKELTTGNLGTSFLLGLIAAGLQILGMISCYIGLLFTAPLIVLMFAVGYLMMSGQRTARV